MARWAPDARSRLQQAAYELFAERGFDATTVAAIADRADLTERTFFRHFADKREVLFSGSEALVALLVSAVDAAAATAAPLHVVASAFEAAAVELFDGRRPAVRQRQAIVDAHPELQERELIKLARLGAAVAGALRRRGVAEPTASLAAEAGVAVFRVAFDAWLAPRGGATLSAQVRRAADALRAVAAPAPSRTRRGARS